MRQQKQQQELDYMSLEEKYKKTSFKEYKKRNSIIEEYKYWYVSAQEYPKRDSATEYILRSKDDHCNRPIRKMYEAYEILKHYESLGYRVYEEANDMKSIPGRAHTHIFKDNVL